MEVQLEEEYEDKQKVLREKRELESKLTTLSEQVSRACWWGLAYGAWPTAHAIRPLRGESQQCKAGPMSGVWGWGAGSVEPTILTCRMGGVTTHGTPGFSHWLA